MGEPFNEKAAFLAALSMPAADREAFLQGACPGEAERSRIRSLLERESENTSDLLERAGVGSAAYLGAGGGAESQGLELPCRLDDFELHSEIGRGGMGIVYLAQDLTLQRTVAIKVLAPHLADSPQLMAGFKQEAVHASQLRHPAIVPVYRFGSGQGVQYSVTPYIDGVTLGARLGEWRASPPKGAEARQWRRDAATALATIAEALDEAHAEGIVHRDVKPSNIMLDERGQPHLLDFGISIRSDEDGELVAAGAMGSGSYASPEQLRGKQVDGRSDVFSLGVVMFESLLFRLPFAEGERGLPPSKRPHAPVPSLRRLDPTVPRDLAIICQKALALSVEERYQSAAHMAADLRAWLHDRPILASPDPLVRRVRRRYQRHRGLTLVSGAVAVTMVTTIALLAVLNDPDPRVVIAGLPPDSSVYIEPMDTATSMPSDVRREVDARFTTFEGFHRITTVGPGGTRAEFTRWLEERTTTHLTARLAPPGGRFDRMVLHDPGQHPIDPSITDGYLQIAGALTAPFLIDRHEVSNGEYEKFVRDPETDVPPPPLWDGPTCPQGWHDLPVVGVTWLEARAYAEWCGKRLPTMQEWLYAARGSEGRLYPSGDGAMDAASLGVTLAVPGTTPDVETAAYLPISAPNARSFYTENVRAVNDRSTFSAADTTPEGTVHMYGNVREWTDSPPLNKSADAIERIVLGFAWSMPATSRSAFTIILEKPIDDRAVGLGFRCARSVPRSEVNP